MHADRQVYSNKFCKQEGGIKHTGDISLTIIYYMYMGQVYMQKMFCIEEHLAPMSGAIQIIFANN